MGEPGSLALELKSLGAHSAVSPQRKAINHFCLLGFCQDSVFTLHVSKRFYLRHMAEFQNSANFRDSCGGDPRCSSQGGSLYASAFCWTCLQESFTQPRSHLQFIATQSRKPAPTLTVLSCFPRSYTWKLCRT